MAGLECALRQAALIAKMQEIAAHLVLAQQIGRAHVVGGQVPHTVKVDMLG